MRTRLYICGATIALAAPAAAEVIVLDRLNSWDSGGWLWAAGAFVAVLIAIAIASLLESRRKKKR